MKYILLIILIGHSLIAFGQTNCSALDTTIRNIRAQRRSESYKNALALAQKTLDQAKWEGCQRGLGDCYNEMGICLQELSSFEQSEKAYQSALGIRAKMGDQRGQANVYENLMSLKIVEGHLEDADGYGKKAMAIFGKTSDSLGIARVYNEYSNLYFNKEDHHQALEYNLKSFKIAEGLKNDTLIAENALNLGNRYYDKERYDTAGLYYQKALDFSGKLGRPRLQGQAMNGLGLALWSQGRMDSVETWFKKALTTYRPDEDMLDISYVYYNLALLYEGQKQFEKAKPMLDSATVVLDSAFAKKIIHEKREIEAYKSLIEILRQNEVLNKEKQDTNQRSQILLASVIVLIFISVGIVLFFQNKKKNHEKELAQQKRNIDNMLQTHQQQYMEARLEEEVRTRKKIGQQLHNNIGGHLIALRNRMENMLLLLQKVPQLESRIQQETKTITDIHEETRRLSRIIEKSQLDASWLENLKHFCDINNQAQNCTTRIDFSLNNMGEPLPSLIGEELYSVAMALIGNALKFAKASKLEIQISNTGDELTLIVSDNGIGFDEKDVEKGSGLRNVREQVAALGGEVHADTSNGSEFIITIPLKSDLPGAE